ncbi:hypothetical protein M1563_00820 [Patescibacteria group bacterium]|nr:hypothetical protein [Patescibacteria group bacterium]MCL5410158.1 hypothetical protein [Patescibacteria group bacterium]
MSRELDREEMIQAIHRILETPFWPQELETDTTYSRLHDDHDGSSVGQLSVLIDSVAGDVWVNTITEMPGDLLRFRSSFGGGNSPRVRNALLVLAMAIKLDNEKRKIE